MAYLFEVNVTQKDADRALCRFMIRNLGIGFIFAIIGCAAFVVWDFVSGNGGYVTAILGSLLVVLMALFTSIFVARRKQMRLVLQRLGGAPVSYHLSDDSIETSAPTGSSTLKWEWVTKLWIDPDLILVFYGAGTYSTIPTSQIPKEALEFLVSKVQSGGGTVIDRLQKS